MDVIDVKAAIAEPRRPGAAIGKAFATPRQQRMGGIAFHLVNIALHRLVEAAAQAIDQRVAGREQRAPRLGAAAQGLVQEFPCRRVQTLQFGQQFRVEAVHAGKAFRRLQVEDADMAFIAAERLVAFIAQQTPGGAEIGDRILIKGGKRHGLFRIPAQQRRGGSRIAKRGAVGIARQRLVQEFCRLVMTAKLVQRTGGPHRGAFMGGIARQDRRKGLLRFHFAFRQQQKTGLGGLQPFMAGQPVIGGEEFRILVAAQQVEKIVEALVQGLVLRRQRDLGAQLLQRFLEAVKARQDFALQAMQLLPGIEAFGQCDAGQRCFMFALPGLRQRQVLRQARRQHGARLAAQRVLQNGFGFTGAALFQQCKAQRHRGLGLPRRQRQHLGIALFGVGIAAQPHLLAAQRVPGFC